MTETDDIPCWVWFESEWRPGLVLRWYKLNGRWRATVQWSDGPGMTHRASFWAEDLRPRDVEG